MEPAIGVIIGTLIGVVISFIVYFYLIRGAVKSTLEDVLSRYHTPQKLLRVLKSIENHMLAASVVPPVTPSTQTDTAPEPTAPGVAHLILKEGETTGRCSECGMEQSMNRQICWKCSAKFTPLG
jgi:hypothetical protein